MTHDRQLEKLVRSWLGNGSADLPSHVLEAVARQLPMTGQRRQTWLAGRFRPVRATRGVAVLAAAVLLLVAIGLGLIATNVGNTPEPEGTPLPRSGIDLFDGTEYGSWAFTEPFTFVMSAMDPTLRPGGPSAAAMERDGAGVLEILEGCCWITWFVDDRAISLDPCQPEAGTLPDIPATPEAVGEWLRASPGLTVSDPVSIPVDGRTALRFEVEAGADCQFGSLVAGANVVPGMQYYAIPSGRDTILYVVWGDPGSLPYVITGAEELVRSIDFR
jgi:hypothetical protein